MRSGTLKKIEDTTDAVTWKYLYGEQRIAVHLRPYAPNERWLRST
ncbi:hypothetical protein [Candidatus Vallotia lariciata]|nr:hypothetical protein [Candidatus Vallotia lariciata]